MITVVIRGLCGGTETGRLREAQHMCGGRYLKRQGMDIAAEFRERSDADLAVFALNTITGVKAAIEELGVGATQE